MIIMKRLQILCLDNDVVQKMDLQIGNNVIGRTIVTGRNDGETAKHAVTISLAPDNEMTITPYQISPCYMRSTESSRWQLLKLGSTVPIKPGDICSLVPDKCWFKVIFTSDKMENNQEHVLKRKANDSIDCNMSSKKSCSESGEGDNLGSPCEQLDEILNKKNNNDINKTKHEDSDSKNNLSHFKDIANITVQKSGDACATSSKDKIEELDSHNELTSEPQNTNQLPIEENAYKLPSLNKTTGTQVHANESNVTAATAGHLPRRERCKYKEKCYRKNPQHKAEFSHPGDADYDIPDDREECPYGLRCYRKNPQHKMQFKHTSTNTGNERSKRSCKQPSMIVLSDTLSELEDSSGEESVEESVDESEYEPSSDAESLDDEETYSDKNGSEDD